MEIFRATTRIANDTEVLVFRSAPHGFGIGNGYLGLGSDFRVWDRDWVNTFTPVSFGNGAANILENPIIWERVWEWE